MKKWVILVFVAMMSLSACDVLQQASELQRLSLCEFELTGIQQVRLAGIALNNGSTRSGIPIGESITLAGAVFNRSLPLDFDLMVKVDNPNQGKASLNRMDYILSIDGKEVLSGNFQEKFMINGGSSAMMKIPVEMDLFKVLQNESGDALVNLAFNLVSGNGQPTEVLLKVKPYIQVGSSQLAYPTYINLRKNL